MFTVQQAFFNFKVKFHRKTDVRSKISEIRHPWIIPITSSPTHTVTHIPQPSPYTHTDTHTHTDRHTDTITSIHTHTTTNTHTQTDKHKWIATTKKLTHTHPSLQTQSYTHTLPHFDPRIHRHLNFVLILFDSI